MYTKDLKKEEQLLHDVHKDKSHFDNLYRYFLQDVYRYSYSVVNNQHDAEDITSQVFITLYNKIDNYTWQGVSMKNWLFTTARNLCYKKFREPVTTELNEEVNILDETEVGFVEEIMNKDLLEKVQEEIQKLSPLEQETINLRVWEGMTYSEIATIQNGTEEAARKRFSRSIKKLQSALKDRGVKSLVPLPVLLTSIKQIASTPAYAAPQNLTEAGIHQLLTNHNTMNTTLTTMKTFLTSNLGIGLIAGTVVLTGAGIGTWAYVANKDSSPPSAQDNTVTTGKQDENQNAETNESISPSPTSPAPDSPTPTEKLNNSDEAKNGWKTYRDFELELQFSYPENFKMVNVDIQEGGEYIELYNPSTPDTRLTISKNWGASCGIQETVNRPGIAIKGTITSSIKKVITKVTQDTTPNQIEYMGALPTNDQGEKILACGFPVKNSMEPFGFGEYFVYLRYKGQPKDEGTFDEIAKTISEYSQFSYETYKDSFISFKYPQGWKAEVTSGNVSVDSKSFTGVSKVVVKSKFYPDSIKIEAVKDLGSAVEYIYDPNAHTVQKKILSSGKKETLKAYDSTWIMTNTKSGVTILWAQFDDDSGPGIYLGTMKEGKYVTYAYGSSGDTFQVESILGDSSGKLPDNKKQAMTLTCKSYHFAHMVKYLETFFATVQR